MCVETTATSIQSLFSLLLVILLQLSTARIHSYKLNLRLLALPVPKSRRDLSVQTSLGYLYRSFELPLLLFTTLEHGVQFAGIFPLGCLDVDGTDDGGRLHGRKVVRQVEKSAESTTFPVEFCTGVLVADYGVTHAEEESRDYHVNDPQDESVNTPAEQTTCLGSTEIYQG